VTIMGPCRSCALNHTWETCRRNPNAPRFDPRLKDQQGPHWIAKIPGYKLGDENGAYKSNPNLPPFQPRDRVAGAGQQ